MSIPLTVQCGVFNFEIVLHRIVMDPTAANRKRNVSTSSVPHQIALNPVQEETSENENSDEETDEESLGKQLKIKIIVSFSLDTTLFR